MRFNSIKFEIGVLYTTILGVTLIVFSLVLYFILSYVLYSQLDQVLKSKARDVARTIDVYRNILGNEQNSLSIAAEKTIKLKTDQPITIFKQMKMKNLDRIWAQRFVDRDLDEDYVNFISSDGKSLVKSANLPDSLLKLFVKDIPSFQKDREDYKNIDSKKRNVRLLSIPFFFDGKPQYTIQIGVQQKPILNLLKGWMLSIAISIPIVLIFTGFVGQFFASKILNPIKDIIRTAQKITHEDLSSRVQTGHLYIEMADLVTAFNEMIGRLEKSFKHIEEFSSHVAHELKTPLTILKGESELALMRTRDLKEYQRAIKVTLEECDRMLKTIEDLLLLTKLDYQPGVFKFKTFDFVEFFTEIYEQSKILAFKKDIHVSSFIPEEHMIIFADSLHLRRLFFNLIDNALKFTPQGGRIDFNVGLENKRIAVAIKDSGPGIKKEDLPRIFERFFSNDNEEKGHGLGLSIAQSIVRIHRGEILVESKQGQGSTFTVFLPISAI